MKTKMWKCCVAGALAFGFAIMNCARGQETIRYYGGPALSTSLFFGQRELDFNGDGQSDLAIAGEELCTASIPPYCSATVETYPYPGTGMLATNGWVAALPFSALIGDEAVAGTQWQTNSRVVVSYMTTPVTSTSGVAPIQLAGGEMYSGFRFNADDGLHYGWIRFRLSFPSGLIVPTQIAAGEIVGGGEPFETVVPQSVDVLDWAYETVAGTAIQAGAVPSPIPIGVGAGSRAGNLRLVWAAESGKAYQLQFKDSLEGTFWQALSLRIVATTTSAAAEVNIGDASQFFRIVRAD